MTKIKLLFSFLVLLTISACSQNKELIIGKWKFVQILDSAKKDELHKYEEEMWYGKMTLYFKPNNHYKAFIMATNEDGIWDYNEKTNKITLTSNKGIVSEIEVAKLSSNSLTIRIGEPTFILEKTTATAEDDIEKSIITSDPISVTKKQISKKWIFKSCEQDSDSNTVMALALNDAMKGTYYHFDENGNYDALLLTKKVIGKWSFGKDNKTIVLTTSNDKYANNIWDIKSVSDTELVLMKTKESDGLSFRFSVLQ